MYLKLQNNYNCPYNYDTVGKVLRENGLLQKRHKPKGLTKADKHAQKSEELLKRDFTANAPCKKLVTDITKFQGVNGKLYVSVIFDCFDNACPGISISDNMKTEMLLENYYHTTCRYNLVNAITHSDGGSQYTSDKFRKMLNDFSCVQSMNITFSLIMLKSY